MLRKIVSLVSIGIVLLASVALAADPKVIPSGGGVVRNMVAASPNTLYLACSGVNEIAVVEIGK